MAENKEYMIHQEEDGAIQISEDVVASIASTTASEVEGVSAMMSANVSDLMGGKKMSAKGVRVEMDGEAIAVNLFIVVRYGSAIGDVAKKVQQMVRTALAAAAPWRWDTGGAGYGSCRVPPRPPTK